MIDEIINLSAKYLQSIGAMYSEKRVFKQPFRSAFMAMKMHYL